MWSIPNKTEVDKKNAEQCDKLRKINCLKKVNVSKQIDKSDNSSIKKFLKEFQQNFF